MGMTIRPLLWATLSVWLVAGTVGGRGAVAAGADDADLRGTSRVAGKPVANAVVWLDAPGAPRATGSTIALEQRNMAFFPRVLAAQVGTVVELPNNDRVLMDMQMPVVDGFEALRSCARERKAVDVVRR